MLTQPNDRIPRLYTGRARDLLHQVRDASEQFKLALDAIWFPLKHRFETHHKVRLEMLDAAQRNWRSTVPSFGRLGDTRIERKNYSLSIAEFRLMTGDLNFDHWTNEAREPSIAIELVSIIVSRKQCKLDFETVAILSLHALARRYERSVYRETDDVLSDLTPIVKASDALLRHRSFSIDVDHGCWCGETVSADFTTSNKPAKSCHPHLSQCRSGSGMSVNVGYLLTTDATGAEKALKL
jgi:hypothetical protein